jgi:hypothetical protein
MVVKLCDQRIGLLQCCEFNFGHCEFVQKNCTRREHGRQAEAVRGEPHPLLQDGGGGPRHGALYLEGIHNSQSWHGPVPSSLILL